MGFHLTEQVTSTIVISDSLSKFQLLRPWAVACGKVSALHCSSICREDELPDSNDQWPLTRHQELSLKSDRLGSQRG